MLAKNDLKQTCFWYFSLNRYFVYWSCDCKEIPFHLGQVTMCTVVELLSCLVPHKMSHKRDGHCMQKPVNFFRHAVMLVRGRTRERDL